MLSFTDQVRFFAVSQKESTTTGAGGWTTGAMACWVAQPAIARYAIAHVRKVIISGSPAPGTTPTACTSR
jgi:hypothetical protein